MPIFQGLHSGFHHFCKATISIILKLFHYRVGFHSISGGLNSSFCQPSYYIRFRGFVNNLLYSVLPFIFFGLLIYFHFVITFTTRCLLRNCYKFSFHSNFYGLELLTVQCFKCNGNSAYPKFKNVNNTI